MDELPMTRDGSRQDTDAPLARDDSEWFLQQLGEEWQPEEPGIYRFVGRPKPASESLERRPPDHADERQATREPPRRWAPWRRQ
jgi:hypothetical protein